MLAMAMGRIKEERQELMCSLAKSATLLDKAAREKAGGLESGF